MDEEEKHYIIEGVTGDRFVADIVAKNEAEAALLFERAYDNYYLGDGEEDICDVQFAILPEVEHVYNIKCEGDDFFISDHDKEIYERVAGVRLKDYIFDTVYEKFGYELTGTELLDACSKAYKSIEKIGLDANDFGILVLFSDGFDSLEQFKREFLGVDIKSLDELIEEKRELVKNFNKNTLHSSEQGMER